jgi:hypothetical protein
VPELHRAIPEKYGFDPTKSFSRAPARSTSRATAAEIPDPATKPVKIRISGKAQQAYVAIEEENLTNEPVNGIKEQGARA